jgi:hypothetical protein
MLIISPYIISMTTSTLTDVDTRDLQYTLTFRMPLPNLHTSNVWCGWLDLQPAAKTARFREDGCTLLSVTAMYATCSCTHTTNYAALIQIDPTTTDDANWNVLNVLTYVCIGISIVCLIITLCVLLYIR